MMNKAQSLYLIKVLECDNFYKDLMKISLFIILYLYFTRDLNLLFFKKSWLYTFLGFWTFVYIISNLNILFNHTEYLWNNT